MRGPRRSMDTWGGFYAASEACTYLPSPDTPVLGLPAEGLSQLGTILQNPDGGFKEGEDLLGKRGWGGGGGVKFSAEASSVLQ